jgi:hypothetical protein
MPSVGKKSPKSWVDLVIVVKVLEVASCIFTPTATSRGIHVIFRYNQVLAVGCRMLLDAVFPLQKPAYE